MDDTNALPASGIWIAPLRDPSWWRRLLHLKPRRIPVGWQETGWIEGDGLVLGYDPAGDDGALSLESPGDVPAWPVWKVPGEMSVTFRLDDYATSKLLDTLGVPASWRRRATVPDPRRWRASPIMREIEESYREDIAAGRPIEAHKLLDVYDIPRLAPNARIATHVAMGTALAQVREDAMDIFDLALIELEASTYRTEKFALTAAALHLSYDDIPAALATLRGWLDKTPRSTK